MTFEELRRRHLRLSRGALWGLCWAGAVAGLWGCAAGPTPPAASLHVEGAPGALAGVAPVAVEANDKLLLQETRKRIASGAAPPLAASGPAVVHVLTLHASYAREQGLTASLPYHSCMGPGFQEAQADVKEMDARQNNFEVSLVLTRDGEPLWQVRSQARVRSSAEAVAFANRLVDRFLADWRAANP